MPLAVVIIWPLLQAPRTAIFLGRNISTRPPTPYCRGLIMSHSIFLVGNEVWRGLQTFLTEEKSRLLFHLREVTNLLPSQAFLYASCDKLYK